MIRNILIFICCNCVLVGCAHEDIQSAARGVELGGLGSTVGLIGSAAEMASAAVQGRKVFGGWGSGVEDAPTSEKAKQFILSKGVEEQYSNSGQFMDFLLNVQTRFKNMDWGDVDSSQATRNNQNPSDAIGRYLVGDKPALIVTDAGSEFRVRFEDEVWPTAKDKNDGRK